MYQDIVTQAFFECIKFLILIAPGIMFWEVALFLVRAFFPLGSSNNEGED